MNLMNLMMKSCITISVPLPGWELLINPVHAGNLLSNKNPELHLKFSTPVNGVETTNVP